jgi:DNA-binding transcriptional MerR regulator
VTAAGRPQRGGLSIGAVLAQLRSDFPDVTISKIRFLESEGLVRPARTASGYRQFTSADVERLRYVLAAQRDRYLPLKVIEEQLDAADQGLPRLRAVDGVPTAGDLTPSAAHRLTREDVLTRAGIPAAVLAELELHGLIRPGAAGYYDPEAAQIASTVRAMAEYGVEPAHLRPFRAAADREIGLVEQVVHRQPSTRVRAEEIARELAALAVTLHTLLVKAGLRDRASPR